MKKGDNLQNTPLKPGFARVNLDKYEININVVTLLPENLVRKYNLIAINKYNNTLILAMADPLNFIAIDDVKLFTKMDVKPCVASNSEIEKIIDKFYSSTIAKKVLDEFNDDFLPIETDDIEEEEVAEVSSAPIVKLLNSIIEQAILTRASDVHIEPNQDGIKVRFRIDGDLTEIMNLPRSNLSALITRIKIMGKMNIAEKRISQDGRIEMSFKNHNVDMRISTLPTVYGEKTVLRLLDKSNFNFIKEDLGFSKKDLSILNNILSQPYGMILVTGPTGSGKSTTLYTILKELNLEEKNVITVEDPVEYKIKGVNQVQVNKKSGLTFASGLRSILRQDPDIIMIGEIRDSETAEIAVRAAITGHLVLSTLHTNDSPSTVARLIDMGIEPYLVSSAVVGIVSQRLVKVLCPKCKGKYQASYSEKKLMGIDENKDIALYKAIGCNACNQGYRGRTAVYELMPVNEGIRRLIDMRSTTDTIRKNAIEDGMTTLFQSVISLALDGQTSLEEALRVGFTLR
jgi:type IV pilus assembly protein PilB